MKKLILPTLLTAAFFSQYSFSAQPVVIYNNSVNKSDFWTPEKLKSAKPLPLIELPESIYKKLKKTDSVNQKKVADEGIPQKADVSRKPYNIAGKLYFTNDAGDALYCSAQFVGSAGLLLTAGHCIRDENTGDWRNNFHFVQADENGIGTNKFDWKYAVTWSDLYSTQNTHINWGRDYAFIHVNGTNSKGFMGWKLDVPYDTFTEIGYPGTFENGKYMMEIKGHKGTVSTDPKIVQMVNNPMRHGNSGGAWVGAIGDNNSTNNYVIGVESFSYNNDSNSTYSPYLDNDFTTLLNFSKNLSSN